MMKRFAVLVVLGLGLAAPAWVAAQSTEDHGEVGGFADYLRFSPAHQTTNFVGVGGRLGVNVHPNIQLEGELNYDSQRNYTSTFTNGFTTSFVTTGIRPLTGLFGPKIQAGTSGPFRVFLTAKWVSSTSVRLREGWFPQPLSAIRSTAWVALAPIWPSIRAAALKAASDRWDCAWKSGTRST